jgi:serine protease Do
VTKGAVRWLLLGAVALCGCDNKSSTPAAPAVSGLASAAPVAASAVVPAGALPSFADLAATADPAVVYVRTLQERTGRGGQRQVVGEGLGSAFVYDPEGLILTNNHVIEQATDIRVIFDNEREMKAEVVGRDPPTDVAVLRVDERRLPYLALGDSDATRVGDWVVAIGNPFGLAHTVSAGIVSAKGRTGQDVRGLGEENSYYNFIQTDASINPGNSGGPLLNLVGRVVGINTAIRAQANNIGFAIPINMVKELLPRLIRDGKVERSAIGIRVAAPLPSDMDRLGLASRRGALVLSVAPGGPGDRAGIGKDDVIVAFDGESVEDPERLRWLTSLAGVGKQAKVKVRRGKRTLKLTVRLGALSEAAGLPEP